MKQEAMPGFKDTKRMDMKKIFPIILLACGGVDSVQAQVDAAQQQRLEQLRQERMQVDKFLNAPPVEAPHITLPKGVSAATGSDVKNIPVNRFEIGESALLGADEIERILGPYRGRMVSLNELLQAVDAINRLYAERQAATSRAVLPAQDVKEGVVRIVLIEARVGGLEVTGTAEDRKSFVRDRLHLQSGDLMSVAQLERDLIRFNSLYQARLEANVGAGSESGQTDITIKVTEPKRHSMFSFVDNAGSKSVGEWRAGLVYRGNGFLNLGDSLQLSTTASKGARNVGLAYSTPVNLKDLRMDVSLSRGELDVISGSFSALDISGRSSDLTVGLTQAFAIDLVSHSAAYAKLSNKNSANVFGGLTQQDRTFKVLSLGGAYQYRDQTTAMLLDNNLTFSSQGMGSDADFRYYRATASRMDKLSDRHQLATRAGIQYSFNDVMPSGEQFQIGGVNTVRGFSEGLLSGRNGYVVSAEWRTLVYESPPGGASAYEPRVYALAFVDHGAIFPYRPARVGSAIDRLTSVGVGLSLELGTRASAQMVAALPLNQALAARRDMMIHALVNVGFF